MERSTSNRVIITVLGRDKVGIIAGVAQVLAEQGVNILDIRQTIMQEFFTMMMVGDLQSKSVDIAHIAEVLNAKGQELGVKISLQHEDVFQFMHRI